MRASFERHFEENENENDDFSYAENELCNIMMSTKYRTSLSERFFHIFGSVSIRLNIMEMVF